MIRVQRSPTPAHLNPADVSAWTVTLCNRRENYYRDLSLYRRGIHSTKPKRPSADNSHYGHTDVRSTLRQMFGPKCAYCETEVASAGPQHVEHYRPASRYPALAYEWDNLLLACPHCNSTHKRDQFPIEPAGNTPKENRRFPCLLIGVGEIPLLLNPCIDNPEVHITFRNGRAIGLTTRGKRTIRVCGLNHDDLVQDRRKWLKFVKKYAEDYLAANQTTDTVKQAPCANDLREFVLPSADYTSMARTELAQYGIDWRTI